MMIKYCIFLLLMFNIAISAKPVFVHYMPWYESKSFSGDWGWLWTMNHFNPDTKMNGRRPAASHFRPLVGLYDSGDPDLIEYHVLLMKLSGIDGVIIDWYGIENFRDYAMVHRNSKKLIKFIEKAGLKYIICYEDQSAKHFAESKKLSREKALNWAQDSLNWLDEKAFSSKAYYKDGDRPYILVFGPQYFNSQEWQKLVSGLNHKPLIFSLPHLSKQLGQGGIFGWPPVYANKTIKKEEWLSYINHLHQRDQHVSVVFPGYKDIYAEAKLHESYGYLDDRDGKTFDETLRLADKSNGKIIQIATWNDFGEGTTIEPTEEYGFKYLKKVQAYTDTNQSIDLSLVLKLYHLRKAHKGDPKVQNDLDRVQSELIQTKLESALKRLKRIADREIK